MDSKNHLSKVLILGGSGLIGSACKRYLSHRKVTDFFAPSHQELELTNPSQVEEYFSRHRPQSVILAAGLVGGIQFNSSFPADFITTNLQIQMNVLTVANKYKIKKLIFFGSSCMYPKECSQPMQEEMILSGKPEHTSINYAMAKLAGLQMCKSYNQQYNEERFITLIPNSTYGPNDNFHPEKAHVMSALISKFHSAKMSKTPEVVLWGSGNPRREFIYSEDVASAVFHVLSQEEQIPLPLNVGVGQDISIKELAEMIANVVKYEGKILWDVSKPEGAPQKLLDSQKISNLGWKPSTTLNHGIQKTYEWYLKSMGKEKSEIA